jgi:TPR repeat protein
MFEAGRGISRDTVEAYMWFSLGTAAGNPDARLRLSDLEKHMAPAQILMPGWLGTKGDRGPNG